MTRPSNAPTGERGTLQVRTVVNDSRRSSALLHAGDECIRGKAIISASAGGILDPIQSSHGLELTLESRMRREALALGQLIG
jgi:hypothetical protein